MTARSVAQIAIGAAAVVIAAALPAAAQSGPYVRLGLGYDWSGAAIFFDRDCAAASPPALFGCGPGVDGEARGAYGWFGSSTTFEIGIGAYAAPAIRVEATLGVRPGFAFSGNANFSNVQGAQPVSATAGQAGVMGFVYADLGTLMGFTGPVQPYVGFGIGVSRNVVGAMLYEFPTLTQPRYSLMPGGVNYDVALAVAAGISYRAGERLVIDLGWRWNRFGVVETEEGELFIQYPNSTLTIPIDNTWAVLRSTGVMLSLRREL
jgi:opacity protein-like surface antigen